MTHQVQRVAGKLRERAGWSWRVSWLVPPWGLLRGLVCVGYRLWVKRVGEEKGRKTRGEKQGKGGGEEIELRERGTRRRSMGGGGVE